jgi:hypothetical protein
MGQLPDPARWEPKSIRIWLWNNKGRVEAPRFPGPIRPLEVARPSPISPEIEAIVRRTEQLALESLDELRAIRLQMERVSPPTALSAEDIMNEFVTLFATKNLPLCYVNDDVFRGFVEHLNPRVRVPSDAEIRKGILQRAREIRAGITASSEGSPYVALMADGVQRAGRLWLATVLATAKRFHFWRLAPLDNQRAGTIADVLADVVQGLAARNRLSIVSVVTDNASNEKSALDPLQDHSVQAKTGVLLFRTPCLSHTVNLAVNDCLKECFPGRAARNDMRVIRDALTHRNQHDLFHSAPLICETRWLSFGEFLNYADTMYCAIHDVLLRGLPATQTAVNLFKSYHIKALSHCCEVLTRLIRWSELEEAQISCVWSRIIVALSGFDALIHNGNIYAADFKRVFFARIMTTADVKQLLLAFVLTHDGLTWFRVRADLHTEIASAIDPLLVYFERKLGLDRRIVNLIFRHYLTEELFPGSVRTLTFWECKREAMVPMATENSQVELVPYRPLCEIALLLCGLPCSEASVERAFSHLRFLFGDYRQSLGAEIVEAMLVIRLNREDLHRTDIRGLTHSLNNVIEEPEITRETAVDSLRIALHGGREAERLRHWGEEQPTKTTTARNRLKQ